MKSFLTNIAVLVLVFNLGCPADYRTDLDYSYAVEQTWQVAELEGQSVAQFESVFWGPEDTESLRDRIVVDRIAAGRSVLEIGTGTGLIAMLAASYGATRVVATEINPAAVACARYNVARLDLEANLVVRQVPATTPAAFAVIGREERFDLIISNPPWRSQPVLKPADHALNDPDFQLIESLLDGLPEHLNPGGRCLIAYGHRNAIAHLRSGAESRGYSFKQLDNRDLADLPGAFLPGMLLEIRVPLGTRKSPQASQVTPGIPRPDSPLSE